MRPLIGITTYYVDKNELGDFGDKRPRGLPGQDMVMSSMDYVRAINKAGGIPMLLSPINDKNYIRCSVEKCDGILLVGGADLNPLLYKEIPESYCGKIIPERDEFELALLDEALRNNKPVLGICRGMQLINVFYGGSLYQDTKKIDNKRYNHSVLSIPKWHYVHNVQIEDNTILKEIFKKNDIKTNSYHHQSIKELGENLQVSSRAQDSTIESIEDNSKYFVLGVQWHPEMMFEKNDEQFKIFDYFIKKIIDKK